MAASASGGGRAAYATACPPAAARVQRSPQDGHPGSGAFARTATIAARTVLGSLGNYSVRRPVLRMMTRSGLACWSESTDGRPRSDTIPHFGLMSCCPGTRRRYHAPPRQLDHPLRSSRHGYSPPTRALDQRTANSRRWRPKLTHNVPAPDVRFRVMRSSGFARPARMVLRPCHSAARRCRA